MLPLLVCLRQHLVGFISRLKWKMGPKLRILNQGVRLPSGIEKERAGSLSRLVERFTFHVTFVKKGLGSPTRYVEQETSPFELIRASHAEHCSYLSKSSCLVRLISSQEASDR